MSDPQRERPTPSDPLAGWSPRKLILASLGVALFSSLVTGGLVVWLLSGKKPVETPVFEPGVSNAGSSHAGHNHDASATPPPGLVEAGNWHYDRRHWAEAAASYEKALAAGTDNPDVRTDLGNCYRFLGRTNDALEQYRIAQSQNPQHEFSLFNTATLYAEVIKDPTKAREVARDFVARFPTSQNGDILRRNLLTE